MTVHLGDCVEVMAGMEAEQYSAIITDPPYDLTSGTRNGSASTFVDNPYGRARVGTKEYSSRGGFMGKTWDGTGIAFDPATWRAVLRLAKPGAYLLAFGGTRTYHRLAVAIEDAGWEIRDCLVWAYASGFPKSRDIGKDMDRLAGAERPVVGTIEAPGHAKANVEQGAQTRSHTTFDKLDETPITPEAAKWNGWGTALKPAWEPIVMARKPFRGTVAANVQEHGTGALNIDATRIPMTDDDAASIDAKHAGMDVEGYQRKEGVALDLSASDPIALVQADAHERGRWPANVVLTDPIFDGDTAGVVGGGETGPMPASYERDLSSADDWQFSAYGVREQRERTNGYGDSGTFSRFFLVPKASRGDREPAVRGQLVEREVLIGAEGHKLNPMTGKPVVDIPRENAHPTVKPVELMRHLVRLVTPPGGTILDPFLGSGTTAVAAIMEGFSCDGIEKEAEYVAIAEARLNGVQQGMGL